MKLCLDTNVLLRVLLDDEPEQSEIARRLLASAERIVIPIPVLCELVWVLRRGRKRSADDVADALDALLNLESVVTDWAAARAGIDGLRRGADFADGAIALRGLSMGAGVFCSFDELAVRDLRGLGYAVATPEDLLRGVQ